VLVLRDEAAFRSGDDRIQIWRGAENLLDQVFLALDMIPLNLQSGLA
jgi:hypothetical protein